MVLFAGYIDRSASRMKLDTKEPRTVMARGSSVLRR